MRYVALFVLGCLVGSAVTMPLVSTRLETVLMERDQMILLLMEHKSRLDKVKEQLAGHRAPRSVESVELSIQGVEDEAHLLSLKKTLQPYAGDLVGQDLAQLDPYLIINVFNDRTVRMDGVSYQLTVEAVVLDTTVRILLGAEKITEDLEG